MIALIVAACTGDESDTAVKEPEVCDEPDFLDEFLPEWVSAACVQLSGCMGYESSEAEIEDC